MTTTSSPLVAAYLADLERRLADAPAPDRLDVLDAVREHLDVALAELGPDAPDDDVRRVLAELGSVDQVAAAMHDDASATRPAPPAPAGRADPSTGVYLLLVLAGLAGGLAVAPLVVVLGLVHPAVYLTTAALLVGATVWTGSRAVGRRAPEPRRPWRIAFAVVLPATVTAGLSLLVASVLLPVVTVGESTGSTARPGVVVEQRP